jgi:hypothetical protein
VAGILLKTYPSERYLNDNHFRILWMRAEFSTREDNNPVIEVGLSRKTIESLLKKDVVAPMSMTGRNGLRRLLGTTVGLCISGNGVTGIKHTARWMNGNRESLENALAHIIEVSEDRYHALIEHGAIEMDAGTAYIRLYDLGERSGGGSVTSYDRGYIGRYMLPGNNPY